MPTDDLTEKRGKRIVDSTPLPEPDISGDPYESQIPDPPDRIGLVLGE